MSDRRPESDLTLRRAARPSVSKDDIAWDVVTLDVHPLLVGLEKIVPPESP